MKQKYTSAMKQKYTSAMKQKYTSAMKQNNEATTMSLRLFLGDCRPPSQFPQWWDIICQVIGRKIHSHTREVGFPLTWSHIVATVIATTAVVATFVLFAFSTLLNNTFIFIFCTTFVARSFLPDFVFYFAPHPFAK